MTQLILNNTEIQARDSDNFINATQLCKAGGKRFNNWYQLDTTKKLLEVLTKELYTDTGIPVSVIDSKKGGLSQGSWIHPDLAVQLAQWISPEFAIQVSRWVRQLFTTGSVSLQNPPEVKELEEKVRTLERRLFRTEDFLNNQRLNYKKEIIYIATSRLYQAENRFKVGGCSSRSILKSRIGNYNTGRLSDDAFFCIQYWEVPSFTMVEKIIKTVLNGYRDTKSNEMYYMHGNSLIESIEFVVQNSRESVEWFNEHFKDFNSAIMTQEPTQFPPIVFTETLSITAGSRRVDLVDITGWSEQKIQEEINSILETYRNLKNLDRLTKDHPIAWGEISSIIRQQYSKTPIADWRSMFRTFIPRRSERLFIKGLKMV